MAKKESNGSKGGMIFVILLALGFIGFLFYLATIPPSENGVDKVRQDAKSVLQQQDKKQAKEAAKKASKPEKPKYDFYELLEKQTVEVPKVEEYKSTPKDQSINYQYLLQVASFRSQEDADSLRASLLLEGLTAYTNGFEGSNGTWYRVYVGPFDNRSKMNQAQDKLVARNLSPLELRQEKK